MGPGFDLVDVSGAVRKKRMEDLKKLAIQD
jgi:hypothetical protein